jgi:hypothetical protein
MTLTAHDSPAAQPTTAPPSVEAALSSSTRTRRILVTGSRTWPWPAHVARVLDAERGRLPADAVLTVIHGACPHGADAAAAAWCARAQRTAGARVAEESHPARWHDERGALNRAAGMIRNGDMVQRRPDLVVAFWADHSPGTGDTLRRTAQARIPALIHTAYSAPFTRSRPEPAGPPVDATAPGQSRPATHRTPARRTQTRTAGARNESADARAELQISQGYTLTENPVCSTCREQKSITGHCSCT